MRTTIKYSLYLFIGYIFCISNPLAAQVQVSKEPMHPIALQNQYIRLLDVWVQPGDTTQFHVHSTPSMFIYFTNTNIVTQIKGKPWNKEETIEGKILYRSFTPDSVIHRVGNPDKVPLHVNDIELLSTYSTGHSSDERKLPYPFLFENDKVVVYRLNTLTLSGEYIHHHGPIVAGLVSGDDVVYHSKTKTPSVKLKPGQFVYIEPESQFYFSAPDTSPLNMVLFEIK